MCTVILYHYSLGISYVLAGSKSLYNHSNYHCVPYPECQHSKIWWVCFGAIFCSILLLLLNGGGIVYVGVSIHTKSSMKKVLGYNGDTVECDQLSPIWNSGVQVSECGDYQGYRVGVFKAEGQLKTYKWTMRMYDTNQSAHVGRFGIPINIEEVPYLFEDSTITILICLQSMNTTTIPVGLFIFDDLQKRSSFIEGKADGTTSVYKQQLPVGSEGQIRCSNVSYDIQHAGYYCLALDSPSNVVFRENLTENVISINNSEYQVDCTVAKSDPCQIDIPFTSSPSVRILCHIPEYGPHDPDILSTHLCSTRQPQWKLLYILSSTLVLPLVVLCIVFIVYCARKCKQNKNRNKYQPL